MIHICLEYSAIAWSDNDYGDMPWYLEHDNLRSVLAHTKLKRVTTRNEAMHRLSDIPGSIFLGNDAESAAVYYRTINPSKTLCKIVRHYPMRGFTKYRPRSSQTASGRHASFYTLIIRVLDDHAIFSGYI